MVRKYISHFPFDHIEINRLIGPAANQRIAAIGRNINVCQIGPVPVAGQASGLNRPARNRLLVDRDQYLDAGRKRGSYETTLVVILGLTDG